MNILSSLFGFNGVATSPAPPEFTNDDRIFYDALVSHNDLFAQLFTDEKILCYPSSNSLGDEKILKEHLMSHILVPDNNNRGDFTTLNNQKVSVIGNELICGLGFDEPKKIKITLVDNICDHTGKQVVIYHVKRPLVGGIAAPEELDEISLSIMYKYIAILRTYPGSESAFGILDEYIKEVNFVGSQSKDGFSRVRPSLAHSVRCQWKASVERFLRGGITLNEDSGSHQIEQIIESYLMCNIYKPVYFWLTQVYYEEDVLICKTITDVYRKCTQTDLGIIPEFQTTQLGAIKELITLKEKTTPTDKLLVLKRCVQLIRDSVDKNVRKKFQSNGNSDVELATDDIVLILIWVIAQAYPRYRRIITDIRYIASFHFVTSSKSILGFTLCHFQVAMMWYFDRSIPKAADKPRSVTSLFKLSMSSPNLLESPALNLSPSVSMQKNPSDEILSKIPSFEALMMSDSPADSPRLNYSVMATPNGDDTLTIPLPTGVVAHERNVAWSLQNDEYYANEVNDIESKDVTSGKVVHVLGEKTDPFESKNTTFNLFNCDVSTKINKISGNIGYYALVNADGHVFTWGRPECGRLGRGVSTEIDDFSHVYRPLRVNNIPDSAIISDIACGKSHMLCCSKNGELFAWGDNRCAQLGISSVDTQQSNATFSAMSYLIGYSTHNELSAVIATSPALSNALPGLKATKVACGAYHSLCLTSDGTVYSWGRFANGRLGQFMDDLIAPDHAVSKPTPIKWNSKNTVRVDEKMCEVGNSETDLLLHNAESFELLHIIPKPERTIMVIPRITRICAGHSHSIALSDRGAVYSWGCGTHGRLGHGDHNDEYIPRRIESLNSIRIMGIAAGVAHTLFLSNHGYVFGCGYNKQGQVTASTAEFQLGKCKLDQDSVLMPVPICINPSTCPSLSKYPTDLSSDDLKEVTLKVKQVSCGDAHSAVITSKDNLVIAWGQFKSSSSTDKQHAMVDLTDNLHGNVPVTINCSGNNIMVLTLEGR
jgi:alpha-tubulin suppressor-like RCC1 family protein